jgi:hypothetical protein
VPLNGRAQLGCALSWWPYFVAHWLILNERAAMSGPYKFLKKSDLPFLFDSHTFVISTPAYFAAEFAQMEIKNAQINDPNDAATIGTHDPIINKDVTAADEEFFRAFGITNVAGAKGLTFVGNIVRHRYPQCFIFSTARGFFPDIKASLTSPPASYDACVKIKRPRELWRQFLMAGKVGEKPLREVFSEIDYQRMRYENIAYKVGSEPQKLPDVFRKDLVFAGQNEWRAVFYPLKPITEQRLVITLDNLTDFISLQPL